jgi:chromosome segregation ATPase
VAVDQACAVWIEQRIEEELEAQGETGESLREISRRVSDEIKKVFEAKISPETIRSKARRLGGSNDPSEKKAKNTKTKRRVGLNQAALKKIEQRLKKMEEQLDTRQKELDSRESKLNEREEKLKERAKGLDSYELELKECEAKLRKIESGALPPFTIVFSDEEDEDAESDCTTEDGNEDADGFEELKKIIRN